ADVAIPADHATFVDEDAGEVPDVETWPDIGDEGDIYAELVAKVVEHRLGEGIDGIAQQRMTVRVPAGAHPEHVLVDASEQDGTQQRRKVGMPRSSVQVGTDKVPVFGITHQ